MNSGPCDDEDMPETEKLAIANQESVEEISLQEEAANIELRSEEVQEILSQPPSWIIRYGITAILITILAILTGSWFIKYPDIIPARVVITTEVPPANIIARAAGNLTFFITDTQEVVQDQLLGEVENPAVTADVLALMEQTEAFKAMLFMGQEYDTGHRFEQTLNVGTMQSGYFQFLNAHRGYRLFRQLELYTKQKNALRERIRFYEDLNQQNEGQKRLAIEELSIVQKRYEADSLLYSKQAITKFEFGQTKNNFLAARRNVANTESSIINNRIQMSQLESQITELDLQYRDEETRLRMEVVNSFKALETQIETWDQTYLLRTPIAGTASFVNYWTDNQFVNVGDQVLSVVPGSQDIFGQLLLPVSGSGKVEIGQTVNIKFDNYPFNEYGMVLGEVETISLLANNEDNYLIRVKLNNGLRSSYNEDLDYKPEMQGAAEIITKDLRIIERVFNDLRSIIDQE